eukprot:8196111-Karenia_brevis.AAC.1
MPLREGNLFLFERPCSKKVWICPACGEPYNLRDPSFILAVQVGSGHQDDIFLKADCPAYK